MYYLDDAMSSLEIGRGCVLSKNLLHFKKMLIIHS